MPLSRVKTWQYFTNDEKLKLWIAPLAHIDLKTGGSLVTNYDKKESLNDTSAIRVKIINYIEYELLTLKVDLNNNFTKRPGEKIKTCRKLYSLPKSTTIIQKLFRR